MKKISFLDDSIESVVSGSKTQTIRLKENFDEGETLELIKKNGNHMGYLTILFKVKIQFRSLTNEDAKAHGWTSIEALIDRIKLIYPQSNESTNFLKYIFKYSKNA